MLHLTGLLNRTLFFGFGLPFWGARRRLVPRPVLLLALLTSALLAGATGCGGGRGNASPEQLRSVTFMAGFRPQANLPFVGAYVAKEKGFFREQGLDVEIRHSLSGESLQLLTAGTIQFTTADAGEVVKRTADPGLDLRAIALIGQKGQQGFAVLADSGINTPRDWAGKTLGYKGSPPPEFYAIARSTGLDPAQVNLVRVGFDPRVLSEKQVDILAVFMSNEPHTLERLGFKTRVFDPNDYGVPLLGLTYIAMASFIEREPQTVERFLKACLKGIEYAAANRDEAIDIVMKYAPQEDRAHQRFMMDAELERAVSPQTRANGIGWQTLEQWRALVQVLETYQAIARPVDPARLYTDEFLKRIYKDGKLVWP